MKKIIFSLFFGSLHLLLADTPSTEQDVTENRIGQVEYVGNTHFSNSLLNKYLQLKPGDPVNLPEVMNNVARMNRSPFHQTEVVFAPGAVDGTTDVRLITQDRPPVRLFGGADDTGDNFTGNLRWMAGLNWANVFNADQILTYQYTGSDHAKKFWAHTANYVIPLPHAQFLALYGSYYEARPEVPGVDPTGKVGQASSRYNFPIGKLYASILQDLTVGFDFKSGRKTVALAGQEKPISDDRAFLTQLVLGYHFGLELESHKISVEPEIFYSPAQWIPHQSKRDFNGLRPFASPTYVYGRLAAGDNFTFRSWELGLQSRLQLSSTNLLSTEQFSLGGYNTVRGYSEKQVDLDNALCLNGELKTPAISLLKWVGKKAVDKLSFLLFADYGMGRNHELLAEEKGYHYLLGVGPGVRYNVGPFLTSRLDWAFPLIKAEGHDLRQRIHFSVLLSY